MKDAVRSQAAATLLVATSMVAVVSLLIAAFVGRAFYQSPQSPKSGLHLARDRAMEILVRGDRQALQRSCTVEGWKQINECYDFQVSALGFRGTFLDFLQQCGNAMQSGKSTDIVKSMPDRSSAVFYYDKSSPEGVTIAFQHREAGWQIAYLSPGEIDTASIFAVPKE